MFTIMLQAASGAQGPGNYSFWIMIVAVFAIMYFFMIRPQNKKQKEIQKFRNSLAVGQEIVTAGGIHGTIRAIDETDNTIMVEVAS
ncbi:MAG: preprotein translocase subunit YajC, partial [Bacteroidaceae bacterium]